MNYNLIGIDPSLISTGICINGKLFNYCRESDAYNKSGLQKWFKYAEQYVNYKFIEYNKFTDYSNGEITKLIDYDLVTDKIITDIKTNIDPNKKSRVSIEGYSYSSDAGAIIDLVTFSTLLRKKLYDNITTDIKVLSPSTLKQESCKLSYKPIDIGKKKEKLEWRNNQGVSGGKFTKREMYLSLVENENIKSEWVEHLRSIKNVMFELSTIKKPYEDINDAYIIYQLLLNNRI